MISARASTGVRSQQLTRRVFGSAPISRPVVAKAAQNNNGLSPLALTLANLALAGKSLAEEAAPAVQEAAIQLGSDDKPLFALSPSEILLVTTPLIGYGLFNIAREQNPKLQFSDALLFMAAIFILGNCISIVAFKTSFY